MRTHWVAILVAFMLFPGASAALTDVGHLLVDGHAFDTCAESSDAHHDQQDEHGCTSIVHTCRCCSSAPLVLAPTKISDASWIHAIADARPTPMRADRALDAHTQPPFRPPAA